MFSNSKQRLKKIEEEIIHLKDVINESHRINKKLSDDYEMLSDKFDKYIISYQESIIKANKYDLLEEYIKLRTNLEHYLKFFRDEDKDSDYKLTHLIRRAANDIDKNLYKDIKIYFPEDIKKYQMESYYCDRRDIYKKLFN